MVAGEVVLPSAVPKGWAQTPYIHHPSPPHLSPGTCAQLFTEFAGDPAKQLEVARLLCIALDRHPESAWQGVEQCWHHHPDAVQAMADAMYRAFWAEESTNAIPCSAGSCDADAKSDAEYLGFRAVPVSTGKAAQLALGTHTS